MPVIEYGKKQIQSMLKTQISKQWRLFSTNLVSCISMHFSTGMKYKWTLLSSSSNECLLHVSRLSFAYTWKQIKSIRLRIFLAFITLFTQKTKAIKIHLQCTNTEVLGKFLIAKLQLLLHKKNNLHLFRKTNPFNGLFNDSFYFLGTFRNENDRRADRWISF